MPANVSIATSFGCPFEGLTPAPRVLGFVERCVAMGVRGVTLADTTGMANPAQVEALVADVRKRFPALALTLHFHDTRGMGLANVYAAFRAGARRFDAALGGIGGCPFAPGATGNICTEDTVHMFEQMGVETGVNLPKLLEIAKTLPALVGHETFGSVLKAGRSCDLHPLPK
jgi:hydroxymethylglutaryl-CoA lyase